MVEKLIDYYLRIALEAQEKHGPNTLVVLENGHFFEVYDRVDVTQSKHLTCCRDVLNLNIARQNSGGYMAGIPTHSIKSRFNLLLKSGFTVVVVRQTSLASDGPCKREVTKVLSPGCSLSEDIFDSSEEGHSILISVTMNEERDSADFCTFDVNTGLLRISQFGEENLRSLSRKLKCEIESVRADEVLVHVLDAERDAGDRHVSNVLARTRTLLHVIPISRDATFDESCQSQMLMEYFCNHASTFEPCIFKRLDINSLARSAIANLLKLLRFVEMHDSKLLKDLNPPVLTGDDDRCGLAFNNDAFDRLAILNMTDPSKSLFSLLNKTNCKLGERLLIERMRRPSFDVYEIQKRLRLAEELGNADTDALTFVETNLSICDVERIYRRIEIGKLQPSEIPKLAQTNEKISNLLAFFGRKDLEWPHWKTILPSVHSIDALTQFTEELHSTFDMESCSRSNIRNVSACYPLFNRGVYVELDAMIRDIRNIETAVEGIARRLSSLIDVPGSVRMRCSEKDGFFLETTKARGRKLRVLEKAYQFCLDQYNPSVSFSGPSISALTFREHTSSMMISSEWLEHAFLGVASLKNEYATCCLDKMRSSLERMYTNYAPHDIHAFVARLDVAFSTVKVAKMYRHVPPTIADDGKARFDAKQLRHPIVERLVLEQKGVSYVANDVSIGCDDCWLLYGVNSVGKSSLLKSVGIAVVMAQSGLYVAANSLVLTPFRQLFTRTGNEDNIFEHHSSFTHEMTELRTIWKRADEKSMVLADELCSSTESESAYTIVAALIRLLSQQRVTFAFATHMFALERVTSMLVNVRNVHLKVQFSENQNLIFDRKLSEGLPEKRNYGVLVAENIVADARFSALIQLPSIAAPHNADSAGLRHSKYSRKLWHTQCQVCSHRPQIREKSLHTHHIAEQRNADSDGFIGNYHKNEAYNVCVLCVDCHEQVHYGNLRIVGYKDTESGRVLEYYYLEEESI